MVTECKQIAHDENCMLQLKHLSKIMLSVFFGAFCRFFWNFSTFWFTERGLPQICLILFSKGSDSRGFVRNAYSDLSFLSLSLRSLASFDVISGGYSFKV